MDPLKLLSTGIESENNSVDWTVGEALAFGSLLLGGIHVRLSGQDVERRTFSHRHHVLHDQKIDEKVYNPLSDLREGQAEYTVCNSSLSEYAKIAFGPTFEAQQLHDTNWIVVDCTTPANIYNLLRCQVLMPFRIPAIVMSPKSLLRHPMARSLVEDFATGTHFQRVISESGSAAHNPAHVQRIVFCTGKVHYDLVNARKHIGKENNVALIRVEKISPFPYDLIQAECRKYPQAELYWAQEEHTNMGAWAFIQLRFNSLLAREGRGIKYAGRHPSASPATGNKYTHLQKQKELFAQAFNATKKDFEGFKP
ncbi:unnamed protein product, partial [Mesorhabditis belari]|uniref:Uncharacterized protein n=1 Tax=Mesorhabditis belari TaxID=2138241 RepID=A0AAF3FHB3_9BILA